MYCLDWSGSDINVFGSWRSDTDYRSVDIMVVPCGMSYVSFDGIDQTTEEEDCNWDKQSAVEYLGETLFLKVLYNQETFYQPSFSKEGRVLKNSRMMQIQSNANQATYVDTHINLHELVDEIDYVQVGQQDIVEFSSISFETPEPSGFSQWPTPSNRDVSYKFLGLWLELAQYRTYIER